MYVQPVHTTGMIEWTLELCDEMILEILKPWEIAMPITIGKYRHHLYLILSRPLSVLKFRPTSSS